MQPDILAFLFAAGTVVLAEMGDKTQLLAMGFAARYKASKVMIGVFIATVLNHGLAVWVGTLIMQMGSAQIWISGLASLSFIFFGLWTLKGDKADDLNKKKTRFGPIATVAGAFFIAEMGDKTQLATVAIATKFPEAPIAVLIGTTAGMLIADGVGIIVGVVMCRKIPERIIKIISAGVFMLFGLIGSYEVSQQIGMSAGATALALAGIAAVTGFCAYYIIKKGKENDIMPLAGGCRTRGKEK